MQTALVEHGQRFYDYESGSKFVSKKSLRQRAEALI